MGPLDFVVSNRLLVHGPWTASLLVDVAAWPLWAFGLDVDAESILQRMSQVPPGSRTASWIVTLLRSVGRVGFPGDPRFVEDLEKEVRAMAEAIEELANEGYVRDPDLERYLAQREADLDEQHQRWKAEGRAEVLDEMKAAQAEARMAQQRAQAEARMAQQRAQAEARMAQQRAQAEAREALLAIADTVAPEAVEELRGLRDFSALRDAVQAIVASLRPR